MGALDKYLADDRALIEELKQQHPIIQAIVAWQSKWLQTQHKHQVEPPGNWWNIWLMLAGRGAGKTRAAAETLAQWADRKSTRLNSSHIPLSRMPSSA